MAKQPGLVRRGAWYYLRHRVPLDLVQTIGRAEVWKSLKTADHREALRRYIPARAALQEAFQEARRLKARKGKLAGGEALRIIKAWLRETDRKAATADFGLFADDLRDALAETQLDLSALIEGDDGESVQAALDAALIAAGWPSRAHVVGSIQTRRVRVAELDHLGQIPAELHDLARRALIEAARRRLDRLNGKPNGGYDPIFNGNLAAVQPVANGHDPDAGGITVGELVEKFRAEKEPGQSAKLRSDFGMLYEVIGDLWGNATPARAITREHCRRVKDLFEALPANAKKRLRDRRGAALTLVQAAEHAKAHGIPAMNPKTPISTCRGSQVCGGGHSKRSSWTGTRPLVSRSPRRRPIRAMPGGRSR